MQYEIIKEPAMMLETIYMLGMYVNEDNFVASFNRSRLLADSQLHQSIYARAQRLQQIMDSVCFDVDRNDPTMRRYFGYLDENKAQRCLADVVASALLVLRWPDFHNAVQEMKRDWKRMQEQGACLISSIGWGLNFAQKPGPPENLIRQIRALKFSKEMQLELCDMLMTFDESVDEMASCMEPYAIRLKAAFEENKDLMQEVVSYWQEAFQKMDPLKLLEGFCGTDAIDQAGERTIVRPLLMCTGAVTFSMAGSNLFGNYNIIGIGSYITTDSFVVRKFGDLEDVTAILKYLGDRKRLEILQCLSKDRLYAMELSECLHMNPGNLSRALSGLSGIGLIRQEREGSRAYYQADRDAFHRYLCRLEQVIFD